MAHDVFLSYSRKDKETMQRLRDGLREAGVKVWTDDNLKVGTPAWESAIQEAIETAHFIVVLLSPDSKKSKWVGREIAYAENFKITVLPVLISEKEKESIPIRLVDYQYASLVGANLEQFVKELADVIIPPASAQPPAPPPVQPTRERQPPPSGSTRSGSTPPWRSAQSPLGAGTSNLRFGQTTAYQDFLQRYRFDAAEWDKRRKRELAEAKARIDKIREGLPDAPAIRPWHPGDQLRLAWWLLMDPDNAYIFQYKTPLDRRVRAGAWLLSLIAYLPLLIVSLAAALGWLPVESDLLGLPRAILPVVVVVCWALTGLFAEYTDDSDFILARLGGGVGLILTASLIGGWQFMVAALVVAVLLLTVGLLFTDIEEARASALLLLGISILGIAGQMLHVDILDQTLPLARMGLPAGLLLLAAILTVGGLWGAVALSPVFQYMTGEGGDDPRSSTDSLTDNGVTTWLLGLGLAVLICITLTVGCAVAVKTNTDVTGWIADRLPDKITGISPDVAFTVAGVDVSFSLVDVTHGLIAGWTAFLVALAAGALMVVTGLIPAFMGDQAFNTAIDKRRTSLFGPLSGVLYVAAYLILLIVPPLSA
jgi:hypothetical protein